MKFLSLKFFEAFFILICIIFSRALYMFYCQGVEMREKKRELL